MEDSRAELKAGIVILVSLAMAVTLIAAVGKFKLSKMTTITVRFKNIKGLRMNDPVRYAGIEIGKVKGIVLLPAQNKETGTDVEVRLRVEVGYPMRNDSAASIVTTITGANSVEIEPGKGEEIKGKSVIQAEEVPSFTELSKQVSAMLVSGKEVMKNIQAATGPEQVKKFQEIIDHVHKGTGSFSGILDENREYLRKSVKDISEAAANLKEMIGKNRPAIDQTIAKFPGMAERLSDILAKAQSAVEDGKKVLEENRGTLHETLVIARDMATNMFLMSEDLLNHPWKLLNPTVKDARSADLATAASQVKLAAQYLSKAMDMPNTSGPPAAEMKQMLDNLKAAVAHLESSMKEVDKEGAPKTPR